MTYSFERLSLTPALSRWERENCSPMVGCDGQLHWFMDWMEMPIHGLRQCANIAL